MSRDFNVLWQLEASEPSDDAYHRGADISMLSQYAHEDEGACHARERTNEPTRQGRGARAQDGRAACAPQARPCTPARRALPNPSHSRRLPLAHADAVLYPPCTMMVVRPADVPADVALDAAANVTDATPRVAQRRASGFAVRTERQATRKLFSVDVVDDASGKAYHRIRARPCFV
jgi:hypothetical protein